MIYNNPIANISMTIWNKLITGRSETRYMHRGPNSSSFGNIYPRHGVESKYTFLELNKNNVPYGDLWGGYYYYVDCAGLIRHILYDINPQLLQPFVELSPLIDIDKKIVKKYPRAKTFYTLFSDDINYKYNTMIRQNIKDLRVQLLDMGWTFFKPMKDLSNMKQGDIMVKNLKLKKNTGHMGIFISRGSDSLGNYANVIESSSSVRKIQNLTSLVREYNKNIPLYKISNRDLKDNGIHDIGQLRKLLVTQKNTDTLCNTYLAQLYNLHQIRGMTALLTPNGGIRLSKWRRSTINNYIVGRIP
jgi:hypothetical protein